MEITISIPDEPVPDYSCLFDFIDSKQGHEFLCLAKKGNISFQSSLLTLKSHGALPVNSSKRVWHAIVMMFTNRKPSSILSY